MKSPALPLAWTRDGFLCSATDASGVDARDSGDVISLCFHTQLYFNLSFVSETTKTQQMKVNMSFTEELNKFVHELRRTENRK